MNPLIHLWNAWNDSLLPGALAQIGVALLIQTSLLLIPGLWMLHRVQKQKSNARTLLGRLLLFANLSAIALCVVLAFGRPNALPTLWRVSLSTPQNTYPAGSPATASTSSTSRLPSSVTPSVPSLSPFNQAKAEVAQTSATPVEASTTPKIDMRTLIGGATALWMVGILGLFAWLVACHFALWRLRRNAQAGAMGEDETTLARTCAALGVRSPQLLRHSTATSPFLMGLFRPAIVLPVQEGVPDIEARHAVLVHEVMHLKRGDLWWNLWGHFACALLWPQPLLWLLCRQLEQINEDACDEAVLQSGYAPQQYAKCLLDWAERQAPLRAPRVAGAGVLTGRSSLARRIQTILSESRPLGRPLSKRARWGMLGGALAVIAAMPFLVSGAPTVSPAPSTNGTQPTATPFDKDALQTLKQVGDYLICTEGVSRGVLQHVWIIQRQKGDVNNVILGSTLQRSADKTHWIMSDGDSYVFSTNMRLVSQTPFLRSTFTASTLNDFLKQQTKAKDKPVTDPQSKSWREQFSSSMPQLAAFQTWAKAQTRTSITGRVVDADGVPIKGAHVTVTMDDDTLMRISKAPKYAGLPGAILYSIVLPKTVQTLLRRGVTTDSDGVYRVDNLAAVPYSIVTAQQVRVAPVDNLPPPAQVLVQSVQVVPHVGQTVTAPDLKMTRGGLVRVRVEGKEDGKPLSGVYVYGRSKQVDSSICDVITNASGEALLRLPEGNDSIAIGGENTTGNHMFVVKVNGVSYCIQNDSVYSFDSGPEQTYGGNKDVQINEGQTHKMVIRLPRYVAPTPTPTPRLLPPPKGTATIVGRVVDDAGRPIADIPVRAEIQQKAWWALTQGAGLANANNKTPHLREKWASIEHVMTRKTRTGADGSFRLDGLTTAPYNLVIASSDGNFGFKSPDGLVASAAEGVWAKEGQVVRYSTPLVLSHGLLIEGQVVDRESGQPLSGVIFGFNGPQLPSSADRVMSAKSDSQGRFTLRVVPGTTSLYIAGPASNYDSSKVFFAHDDKSAENVARIAISQGLYAGSGNVKYEVDGGAPQEGLNLFSRDQSVIKIPVQQGQTRRIKLYLYRLKVKTNTR